MSIMPSRGVCLHCGHDHDKPMFNPAADIFNKSEDTAMLDFIEAHPEKWVRHHKGRWALVGSTSYPFETHKTLREAIRHAVTEAK